MFERLIFPTLVEQEATRQLLTDNWPGINIVNLGTPEGLCLEIHLSVDEAIFFRWAYVISQNPGTRVLTYCYRYSIMMLGDSQDMPSWMTVALSELRAAKLLREDNSQSDTNLY